MDGIICMSLTAHLAQQAKVHWEAMQSLQDL